MKNIRTIIIGFMLGGGLGALYLTQVFATFTGASDLTLGLLVGGLLGSLLAFGISSLLESPSLENRPLENPGFDTPTFDITALESPAQNVKVKMPSHSEQLDKRQPVKQY